MAAAQAAEKHEDDRFDIILVVWGCGIYTLILTWTHWTISQNSLAAEGLSLKIYWV